MFTFALNEELRLGLGFFGGASNSDDDFERYLATTADMDRRFTNSVLPLLVLYVERGNPMPDARWRLRIADATANIQCKPLFAMVAESPLVRGVVTAINWIRPPVYEHLVTGDLTEAAGWADRRRSDGNLLYPELVRLLGVTRAMQRGS